MAQPQLKSQRAVRDWPFNVKPLHPVLGCEITGITLAEAVSPAMFAKVYEAFLDYELILFRDVDLPPATQVAFARNFGEVQIHVLSQYHGYKDHPEIYMLSNLDKDGNPSGKHPDRGTTGFDAGTGSLTRIDVRGREGRSLTEDWGRDIRTMMGLGVHGYPNLLTTAVPLAPSAALCNMTTCLSQQTEWISDAIKHVREQGKQTIEPTKDGEDAWVAHHEETSGATLIAQTTGWYLGSNVPGKPRRVLSYCGGVGTYRQKCDEVAANGYPGFAIA